VRAWLLFRWTRGIVIRDDAVTPSDLYHRRSKAWRALYFVCTLLVSSYLFFEVLDLDGSNFPLKQFAVGRTAAISEAGRECDVARCPENLVLRGRLAKLSVGAHGVATQGQLARARKFSTVKLVRSHGYRIALPRSSPSDPSDPL